MWHRRPYNWSISVHRSSYPSRIDGSFECPIQHLLPGEFTGNSCVFLNSSSVFLNLIFHGYRSELIPVSSVLDTCFDVLGLKDLAVLDPPRNAAFFRAGIVLRRPRHDDERDSPGGLTVWQRDCNSG